MTKRRKNCKFNGRISRKKPIDKITITDITVNCDMTRQVFYRYFVDKYDLINWMYEEDCGSIIYTGEENFSLKSWIEYIIDILEDKKVFMYMQFKMILAKHLKI